MADDATGRKLATWLIQGPFDLRLATGLVALGLALGAWRTWPSAYAFGIGVIALIFAVICGVACATGREDLYEPPESDD